MRLFTSLFVAVMILTASMLFAQNQPDNPNLDQVPQYLRERASVSTEAPLSSVITIGNWDNYSLGVDFGESNMAENPNQPAWYFTAYNTNAPHNTQNGIDWAINTASFGTTVAGDPIVAYDSLGNLFYENMYGSISGCKLIVSTNNGVTWGSPVTAIAGVDKNWMACDQTAGPYANYVYTTMTNSSTGNFARSTNHGASFTSTFSPATQTLPGMMVCVGPQGNIQGGAVYVVTNSGSSFAATYTFYRSNNGGASFTQRSSVQWPNYVGTDVGGRNSVQNMRTRPYPMIAADNSYGAYRGYLYCVYASNTPSGSGNKPNIYCRTSTDGGATWGSAVLVNDDVNTQNNHQWHPAVWCDKQTGRLYVMWMDTRDTPASDYAYIYASYSDNGGASFAANQKISNAAMKIDCSTCGGGGTPRYQGDYNGVVSNKKVSMIGWTDFRAGTFQSMTAYFPDFALSIDHTSQILYNYLDSATFTVSVPEVKLYTDTVFLTTTISPTPATGTLTVNYPSGNSMTAYPGSKPVRIVLQGNVPIGTYTATFVAASRNGTPVHRRTATISVQIGTNGQAAVTLQPNRSRCVGDTVHVPIHVSGTNIKNMAFYVSYDHANLIQSGTLYTSVHSQMSVVTYNPDFDPTTLAVQLSVNGTSGLTLTNAKVIDLVFTISGSGSTLLHLRKTPDTAPLSGIWNGDWVPYNQVTYADNTITPTTGPLVGVTIETNQSTTVCSGTNVAFSANPVNEGTSPVYQWKVNGENAGTNNWEFDYTPSDGDVVSCELTSNLACASGNPALSNVIALTVNPNLPVSLSIDVSANPVLAGVPVTFTAIAQNEGTSPNFQWKVNGENTGTNDPGFEYTPANNDVVSCVLTSNLVCTTGNPATSNEISMKVKDVQLNTGIQDLTITDTRCFDAIKTITVAGNDSYVSFLAGSHVSLIAGESIVLLPTTTVAPGAYLIAQINYDAPWCGTKAPSTGAVMTGTTLRKQTPADMFCSIYPNPTSGNFSVDLHGINEKDQAYTEVYSATGEIILKRTITGRGMHEFSLTGRSSGLYYIRVSTGKTVFVGKIILAN